MTSRAALALQWTIPSDAPHFRHVELPAHGGGRQGSQALNGARLQGNTLTPPLERRKLPQVASQPILHRVPLSPSMEAVAAALPRAHAPTAAPLSPIPLAERTRVDRVFAEHSHLTGNFSGDALRRSPTLPKLSTMAPVPAPPPAGVQAAQPLQPPQADLPPPLEERLHALLADLTLISLV